MDTSTEIGALIVTALASPKLWTLAKRVLRLVESRSSGSTEVQIAQLDSEQKMIGALMERVTKLEARIEALEHERVDAVEKLAEARAETKRVEAVLAEREDYIRELEADHAEQGRQIAGLTGRLEDLTRIMAEKYRTAGA